MTTQNIDVDVRLQGGFVARYFENVKRANQGIIDLQGEVDELTKAYNRLDESSKGSLSTIRRLRSEASIGDINVNVGQGQAGIGGAGGRGGRGGGGNITNILGGSGLFDLIDVAGDVSDVQQLFDRSRKSAEDYGDSITSASRSTGKLNQVIEDTDDTTKSATQSTNRFNRSFSAFEQASNKATFASSRYNNEIQSGQPIISRYERTMRRTARTARGPFSSAIKTASGQVSNLHGRIKNINIDLTKTGLIAGGIGLTVGGSLVAGLNRASEYASELGRRARQTGISIRELQEVSNILITANIADPTEALDDAHELVRELSNRVGEAIQDETGAAFTAFQTLGIDVEALRRQLDTEPNIAIFNLIDRIGELDSRAIQTFNLEEIFGGEGSRVAQQWLSINEQQRESIRLAAEQRPVFTEDQVMRLEEYRQSLGNVSNAFGLLSANVLGTVLPALTSVINSVSEAIGKSPILAGIVGGIVVVALGLATAAFIGLAFSMGAAAIAQLAFLAPWLPFIAIASLVIGALVLIAIKVKSAADSVGGFGNLWANIWDGIVIKTLQASKLILSPLGLVVQVINAIAEGIERISFGRISIPRIENPIDTIDAEIQNREQRIVNRVSEFQNERQRQEELTQLRAGGQATQPNLDAFGATQTNPPIQENTNNITNNIVAPEGSDNEELANMISDMVEQKIAAGITGGNR